MADELVENIHDIKADVDQYFKDLAKGEKKLKFPFDKIQKLPEPKEMSKKLVSVIAGYLSESNDASELDAYTQMRQVDDTVKIYNLLRLNAMQSDRIKMLGAIRNNIQKDLV